MRWLTAGESHGQALVGTLEGVPAGLRLGADDINRDLARRQQGYGRGGRMKIERDQARILSGLRGGLTLGSPIALLIENRDWANWTERMAPEGDLSTVERVVVPRPGHADLAGVIKYQHEDIRNVLERSSARETTMRVALAGIAKRLLGEFNVRIASHIVQLGPVKAGPVDPLEVTNERSDASPVRCTDPEAEARMVAEIDAARERGDTLGGVFEVVVTGLPIGLGSYVHWDRKLDACLAQAILSINAFKGVEFGGGFEACSRPGSAFHDEMMLESQGIGRRSNTAGGLEGGMTNGEPVIVRGAMKPLSTLRKPLESVDLSQMKGTKAHYERSDVCALPAAGVIGEAMVALVMADAFLERYGSDSMAQIRAAFEADPQAPPPGIQRVETADASSPRT